MAMATAPWLLLGFRPVLDMGMKATCCSLGAAHTTSSHLLMFQRGNAGILSVSPQICSYLPGFPSTGAVRGCGTAAMQTEEPCVCTAQILGTVISGGCPSLGMGPECSTWLSPALPCPGHVPESSTESAAVMTCKHTNTKSKVVIIYLQETTQGERICVCSECCGCCCGAQQCFQLPLKPPTLLTPAGKACPWGRILPQSASCFGKSVHETNKMLCYVQQSEVLLYTTLYISHSLSCDSVLPMEQKYNFTTHLHSPITYLLKRDRHIH